MTSIQHQSRRVLVVDDNHDAADSLALVLGFEGYEARCAFDGVEALEVCREFKPSVVVLDLNMPRLDGFDTAEALGRWEQPPVLIALSADSSDSTRARTSALGFRVHLVKPADLLQVLDALQAD